MSEQRLKFAVSYNYTTNPTYSIISVEEGKIVEVYERVFHALHGQHYTASTYTQENDLNFFEYKLSEVLKEMLYCQKNTYEELVNSLNSEMLEFNKISSA